MATEAVRVALKTEIERVLNTISTGVSYHTTVQQVFSKLEQFEQFGAHGVPGVAFSITGSDGATPHMFDTSNATYSVMFALYAQASATVTADDAVERLARDVERALMAAYKDGSTRDNLTAACGARFVSWSPARVGEAVFATGGHGAAYLDLEMSCLIQRGLSNP